MPDCSLQHTGSLGFRNITGKTVEICYAQAVCRYNVNPPYVRNTGVLTTGQETGGNAIIGDLCIDNGILIAGTNGSIALKLRASDGSTKDYNHPGEEAEEGKYWTKMVWSFNRRIGVSTEGIEEEILYFEFEGEQSNFSEK